MPDDIKEEIAEQDPNPGESDEALDSFLEDDEPDNPDDDEKGLKTADGPTDDDDPKPESEKPDDDKPEPKPEPEPEKDKKKDKDEPVYSDAIDKRIKDIDDKTDEPEEPEKPDKTEKPPEEPKKDKSEPPPGDSFGDLPKLDLPDNEIKVGDQAINLKDYQEYYPEDYAAIMAISNAIANKIVQQHLEPLKKIDDLSNKVEDVAAKQSDTEFWGAIVEKHSDARAINKSKDFLDWLDKQDAPIQRIAKNMETPEDGIMIIDYYKASQLNAKVDDANKKAKDKKKKTDDLHKGTMRSKANVKVADGVDMDDARAAFDEDDD